MVHFKLSQLQDLSFPRRRESHVKDCGLLWDSRFRGNDRKLQRGIPAFRWIACFTKFYFHIFADG